MESEETIRYIENIINATYITATLKDKDGDIIEEGLVNQQVIQDLLDLYNKEKQEKNYLIKNSISKKKIEDKIEDYQERMRYYQDEFIIVDDEYYVYEHKVEGYKELLEDK